MRFSSKKGLLTLITLGLITSCSPLTAQAPTYTATPAIASSTSTLIAPQVSATMQGPYLTPEHEDLEEISNPCGDAVIEIAMQALGHPYVLGASQWDPKDLPPVDAPTDCSAYTRWVYNRYAYLNDAPEFAIDPYSRFRLSRIVLWQAENIGRVVDHDPTKDWKTYTSIKLDCSLLQKGDLLFFYNPGTNHSYIGLAHMGIYYGDCKMIHAGETTQGVGIIEDLLKYSPYGNHYVGAKRVCPDAQPDKRNPALIGIMPK